jgi:NADH dehydrogenase FAD-containing subunit
MANVVVLGAGLGGIPTAYELRKKLDSSHRVAMVGAHEYFEFTPSNPWIAVGWRQLLRAGLRARDDHRRGPGQAASSGQGAERGPGVSGPARGA